MVLALTIVQLEADGADAPVALFVAAAVFVAGCAQAFVAPVQAGDPAIVPLAIVGPDPNELPDPAQTAHS